MSAAQRVILMPDAGPLITLAYADALDLLFRPGWVVSMVDMVLEEVTRNQTPTSHKLTEWMAAHQLPILDSRIYQQYKAAGATGRPTPRKSNLGEWAIQEKMNDLALEQPPTAGIFLFEDHKIATATFLVPDNCRKVSTRAFLLFLEQKGWIDAAAEIEAKAILAGRQFSALRFP